jgi:dipeptidyl aminopeptidase/acylaminoacyl peptidase
MNTRRTISTAALLLLLLAACSVGSAPSPPQTARTSTSPLDPTGARSADTALSGRIVFDNFDDVWSINADGTDLTRLTRSPWPEFDATWSPDGTQIAFRSEPKDGDPEIWLMNADGSEQQGLARGLSPAWSPDGSKIAYASPGTSFVLPAAGAGAQGSRS